MTEKIEMLCGGVYSKSNISHHRKRCKACPRIQQLMNELENERKEKDDLKNQLLKALQNQGQTINNINNPVITNNIQQNNNIIINNYGDEDLSHITNSVLESLLSAPGDMINNLTKMIHFNKDKPENMNMYIPSRKQKYIKVYKKNQWMLEKKNERIPDLVDRNYNIIDSFYEDCGCSD